MPGRKRDHQARESCELDRRVDALEAAVRMQKQSEAELRDSAQQHLRLLHELRVGIVVHAPDTGIVFSNQEALRILGLSIEQAQGKKALDPAWRFLREDGSAMPPEEYPVNRVLATRQPLREYVVGVDRPAAGDRAWGWVHAFPEFGPEQDLLRIVVTFIDITALKRAEDLLRDSEQRYRVLHESMMDAFVRVDMSGSIVESNKAYQAMLGYTSEELGDVTYKDLTPERWHAMEADIVDKQVLPLGYSGTYEKEYRRKSGSVFPVELRTFLVRDQSGRPTFMWAIVRDITERKQAEEAMRESELSLQAVLQSTADGILAVNHENQTLFANERFAEMWRIPAELMATRNEATLLQHVLGQLVDPQGFLGRVQELYHTDRESFDTLLFKDGRVFERLSRPLKRGAQLSGRVWSFRDITARRRVEESQQRLAKAIEQAAETIVITDAAGRILYTNPVFERTTGYSLQEAMGQTMGLVQSGQQDKEFYGELWRTISSGKTWEGRFINRRKDGSLYTEEATISPVRDDAGEIVSYVAVKRDITEHLQLTAQLQQAQKMESVGRLAGGVAHDFNNLLTGIMGYAHLCRDGLPPEHPVRAHLDEITLSAERSANLTRQLLAFARKQTIAPKVLDLNDTVAGTLKLLRRMIGDNIELAWMPGASLGPVKLDPVQLDQILINLCVNARDAICGAGRIAIETANVSLDDVYCADHAGAVPGRYVLLAVSDNGCGMEKDVLAHAFEPFFTTKEVGQGTGLGLATVYGIVKQNRGYIDVYSEPGQGTAFKIYLPRHVGAGVGEEQSETGAAEVPMGRGETVLLVEDEKSVRLTGGHFLKTLGYNVMEADTSAQALEMAARHPGQIHLLLTDLVMPGMDGRRLAEKLAATMPALKVLFMSGYTADAVFHQGAVRKGVAFIGKPFQRDELARKVRETLEMP